MFKDYGSTSIFLFNCYLCLGTIHFRPRPLSDNGFC
jgi:hypothetical protein